MHYDGLRHIQTAHVNVLEGKDCALTNSLFLKQSWAAACAETARGSSSTVQWTCPQLLKPLL